MQGHAPVEGEHQNPASIREVSAYYDIMESMRCLARPTARLTVNGSGYDGEGPSRGLGQPR